MRKNKGGFEIWATEAEILAVSSVFDCNIKEKILKMILNIMNK
jgi:hypothetical protein